MLGTSAMKVGALAVELAEVEVDCRAERVFAGDPPDGVLLGVDDCVVDVSVVYVSERGVFLLATSAVELFTPCPSESEVFESNTFVAEMAAVDCSTGVVLAEDAIVAELLPVAS